MDFHALQKAFLGGGALRKPAILIFWLAVTVVTSMASLSLYAVTCANDLDCANRVWGNAQTFNQQPNAPPAYRFNSPVPMGMSARAIGMGEAFAGLSDELGGIWYNPAGLTQMEKNEITWMSGDRYTDIPYTGFLSASYMLQNRMVFALSWMRPWHATGAYPSVLSGQYAGFSKWPNTATALQINPGEGQRMDFTQISDTAVQDFLRKAYRYYINPPFQENNIAFTYATPLSPDQNLSFGINVKYTYNDSFFQADNQLLAEATGWGVDLGFQYRHPLRGFGRQLAFGLNVRDMAGQVRFNTGGSQGREITLAPVSDVGIAWKTVDPFTHSDLNLAADFIYINDPALDDDANRRAYFGAEMWFFKNRISPRAGYKMYFNRQLSGPTLGISFRYLIGLDYAYVFPQENEDATHWFTLSYRWGGIKKEIPLPDVQCTVDPPIFAPKKNEYATFTLSAESKNGVERWTLNLIDRNNMVVKSYQDRGEPPAQIIWGGEDKTYRLLPDGEYTFLFTATDHLGSSSSTPVQTLKLYTPPEPEPEKNSLDALRRLIKAQQIKEEAIDDDSQKAGQSTAKIDATARDQNRVLPEIAKEPEAPQAITPLAQARADAGSLAYPRVNDVPFAQTQVITGADGKKVLSVTFQPQRDDARGILRDMADVARVAASDVGLSVTRYEVVARYGQREFKIIAPAQSAYSLSRGFVSREQFLETAKVTLDGSPINPSYRD